MAPDHGEQNEEEEEEKRNSSSRVLSRLSLIRPVALRA
jgi:hypothetical protein